MDKCFGRGQNPGPWISLTRNNKNNKKDLIDYRGGPVGYVQFEEVPNVFSGCEFSLKMTNLAGEYSGPFKVKLACPDCEKESKESDSKSKFGKLMDNKNLKNKINFNKWRNDSKKNKKNKEEVDSSPLNKE